METILEVERLVPANGHLSAGNGAEAPATSPLDLVHAAHGYWRALSDLLGRIPPVRNADPRWFTPHADMVCLGGRVDAHTSLVGSLADPAFAAMAGPAAALMRDDALQTLAEEQVQLAACLPELWRHRQPIQGRKSEVAGSAEWLVMPFSTSGETIDAVLAIYARSGPLPASGAGLRAHGQLDQVLLDAVERSKTGVAVLNADDEILYMNAAARPVLAAGGSIGLTEDGRIELRSSRAVSMIEAARTSPARIYRALLDDMIFFVQPCELGILLAFRMLDANLDLVGIARETFKLTPAEARIAVGIAMGRTVQETALLSGVTADTARSQLKAALARMGISRQQELVRRFCLAATV